MQDQLDKSKSSNEQPLSRREQLILDHIGMVRAIARRIQLRLPRQVPLEDLVSIGVLGLIHAVDNYDPTKQTRLSTYADYKIRGAILDSLRREDCVPRTRRKQLRQIEASTTKLQQELGRTPADEEVAADLGIPLELYYECLADAQGIQIASVDAESDLYENLSLLEFIADNQVLPSVLVERLEMESMLTEEIQSLPPVERSILSLYYQRELAPHEIAQVVGLKSTRVSQIRCQAVVRLRAALTRRLAGKKPRTR